MWIHVAKTKVPAVHRTPKEAGPIHERAAKKGHGAAAGLGDPFPAPRKSGMIRATTDAGLPRAVFVFRYGPEGMSYYYKEGCLN
jgi:hypothetical protein